MLTYYHYTFRPELTLRDAETCLHLARIAVEGLHGETRTRLEAPHLFDERSGACFIDAGTPVGRDLVCAYTALLRRLFGDASFRVEQVTEPLPAPRRATEVGA